MTEQLDGLYQWQLVRQDMPGRSDLSTQQARFTPGLYDALQKAYGLPLKDGRYVDFDVFSGTQVMTQGATVQGCRSLTDGQIEAAVSVQVGLRGRSSEQPQVLLYRMLKSGPSDWRIADITYRDQRLSLSAYLAALLAP